MPSWASPGKLTRPRCAPPTNNWSVRSLLTPWPAPKRRLTRYATRAHPPTTPQAREWHPDRHQEGREQAEQRFQEISEAFQILSDEVKRRAYDTELDAARTVEETKKAAQRFRATSWNSKVPDVAERLKNAKREEPGFPPHIIAGALVLVTGNFILMLNWLGG